MRKKGANGPLTGGVCAVRFWDNINNIAAKRSKRKGQWMAHFSIGHIVRLRDGMFAVRSADYPACEGRDQQVWPAREQFRQALSARVRQAIQRGEAPPLFLTLQDAVASLPAHCKNQLEAPDRQPNTFDYAVIVEVELAAEEAERFISLRIGKLLPEQRL